MLADDLTTTDGRDYKNVTISRADPDGLVLVTDAGIEKVPFTALPAEIQQKYGYDPQKAAAFQGQIATQRNATAAQLATKKQAEAQQKEIEAKSQVRRIEVVEVLKNGVLAHPMYERSLGSSGGSSLSRIGGGGSPGISTITWEPSEKFIFVKGLSGVTDNQRIEVKIYQAGVYHYDGTWGENRTLENWVLVSIPPNK
ncbi:MAG: hypothetical protein ACFUZC_16450 [Chthoniobacteraceae bacterium]